MIGTLDDPSLVNVNTHIFADEAFSWVSFPKDHIVYAKRRTNEAGTPAIPIYKPAGHFL